VGVFGVLKPDADLGPARDSLRVDAPLPAARRAVGELRAQGAQVVVALSQLGRAASESLGVQVPGIDLVVGGGGVPVTDKATASGGARVLNAGAQGWYVGLAEARFDREGALRGLEARAIELGPHVRTEPATAARVKVFEDSLNAAMRRRQASFGATLLNQAAPHFLGQSSCVDCHRSQYAQWRTTAHARAWRTLVDLQKESTTRCVPCHVTGHGQPGGFRTADDAARFGDVQCEACHGMGTGHHAWTEAGNTVTESVCRTCHTSETSPTFTFAAYRPHVLHSPPPGLQPLPESPAKRLQRMGRDPHAR
jgi:cytochrome c1